MPGTKPVNDLQYRCGKTGERSGRAAWQLCRLFRGVCTINSKRAGSTQSVWAALCGRCGGANTSALAMLRGPIRRRPYNRGEIVAKKRGQLILLNDFYWCVDQSPSRGCTAERGADEAIRALAGSTWCNQLRRISSISTQLSPTGGCLHCLKAWQRPVESRRTKQR